MSQCRGIAIRYRRCPRAKSPSVMCIIVIYLFAKPNMIASKHIGQTSECSRTAGAADLSGYKVAGYSY